MSPRFIYKIGDNNEVSIFDTENPNENGAPNIFQAHVPNGYDTFESEAQAKAWAEELIENMLKPPVPSKPIKEIAAEVIDTATGEE
jgi:hypothetical protein